MKPGSNGRVRWLRITLMSVSVLTLIVVTSWLANSPDADADLTNANHMQTSLKTSVSLAKTSANTPWSNSGQVSATSRDSIAAAKNKPSDNPIPQTKESGTSVDIDAGKAAFTICGACHDVSESGVNKVGPNLWSVFGRSVAADASFNYSASLKAEASRVWDVAYLDAFLENPMGVVPGTTMVYPGIKNPEERRNVIAWLSQQSSSPADLAALSFSTASAKSEQSQPTTSEAGKTDKKSAAKLSPEQEAEIDARVAILVEEAGRFDYQRARYHPIHFSPRIETASDRECLVCHEEILSKKPLATSPAGVDSSKAIAWYQTLDTYEGEQESFHWRHIESPFAKKVMNLSCNFCHKGNDPREESADMVPDQPAFSANAQNPSFTLRKQVNPTETCLRCHGAMSDPVKIMGLPGPWHESGPTMESEAAPNGCLLCHGVAFRTVRHQVNYLHAENIEEASKSSSDTCYGCHGGRAWYRIAYPYARNPWPGMSPATPEWAKGRPTESEAQYRLQP